MALAFEGSDSHSNPFRVFTWALCSIYGRSFIEFGEGHLKRFPRKLKIDNVNIFTDRVRDCIIIFLEKFKSRQGAASGIQVLRKKGMSCKNELYFRLVI